MAHVVSPTIADRVAAVLATAPSWTHGTRKSDGREFFIIPASKGAGVYYADATDCTCPCARNARTRIVCKHSAAVALFLADRPVFSTTVVEKAPGTLTCDDCGAALPAHVVGGSMCGSCWQARDAVKQELVRADRAAYKARLRAELGMTDEAA